MHHISTPLLRTAVPVPFMYVGVAASSSFCILTFGITLVDIKLNRLRECQIEGIFALVRRKRTHLTSC